MGGCGDACSVDGPCPIDHAPLVLPPGHNRAIANVQPYVPYEVYVANTVRHYRPLVGWGLLHCHAHLLTASTPTCPQMTMLAQADETSVAGGRSRHPLLLVYRTMLAFFRVEALQGFNGEGITDRQAADVEAEARERFEALLVQFLATRQPTCMSSFSDTSYQRRLLVRKSMVALMLSMRHAPWCCRCLMPRAARMHPCHAVGGRSQLRRRRGAGSALPGGRQRPRRQRRREALLARPAPGRCGRHQPVSGMGWLPIHACNSLGTLHSERFRLPPCAPHCTHAGRSKRSSRPSATWA